MAISEKDRVTRRVETAFAQRSTDYEAILAFVKEVVGHLRTIPHFGHFPWRRTDATARNAAKCYTARIVPEPGSRTWDLCVAVMEHLSMRGFDQVHTRMLLPLAMMMFVQYEGSTSDEEPDFGLAGHPIMEECVAEMATGKMRPEEAQAAFDAGCVVIAELDGYASWLDCLVLMLLVSETVECDHSTRQHLLEWDSGDSELIAAIAQGRNGTLEERKVRKVVQRLFADDGVVLKVMSAIDANA